MQKEVPREEAPKDEAQVNQYEENAIIKPRDKKSQDDKGMVTGKVKRVRRLEEPHNPELTPGSEIFNIEVDQAAKGYMTARHEPKQQIEMVQ